MSVSASLPSWVTDEPMMAESAAPARPLKCLLVEDSRFDRSLVRYSAERAGVDIQFTDAVTLSEARTNLNQDDFQLILLDRGLPDGDGLDLPAELAEGTRNHGVPTVMLSGGDEDFLGDAARAAGCVDFLSKQNLSAETLAEVIREVMDTHTLFAPDGPGAADEASAELQSLLGELDDLGKLARIKPLASRMTKLISDIRGRIGDDPSWEIQADVDEMSELCLMLWMEVDGAQPPRSIAPMQQRAVRS